MLCMYCFLTARTIKQEEGAEEETERQPVGPDETLHSGEEGSGLEEPMIDSPNNLQDAGPGAEAQSEIGIRQPNGTYNSLIHLIRSRKQVTHFPESCPISRL